MFAEVDAARLHHQGPGVELGEVEQIRGQLGEAVDLLAHRVHELGSLLWVGVLLFEQLDEAAETEDRRTQLVGGVGDELLAGDVELGETALHLVEGAGELPQFARGGNRDLGLEITVGDLSGGILEPSDLSGGHLCEIDPDDRRQRQGDQPAGDHLSLDLGNAPRGRPDPEQVEVDDDQRAQADCHRGDGDPAAEVREARAPHYSLNR